MAAEPNQGNQTAAPAPDKGRKKRFGRKGPAGGKGPIPGQPVKTPRMTGWVVAAVLVFLLAGALSLNLVPGMEQLMGKMAGPEPEESPVVTELTTGSASAFQGAPRVGNTATDEFAGNAAPPGAAETPAGDEPTAKNDSTAPATGTADSARVRQVAELYDAMPPVKAGPLLAAMEPEEAAAVLRLMKREQAAASLAHMEPEDAAQLVDLMMTNP